MKRHPSLLQLSREHHVALKLALDCRKASSGTDDAAAAAVSRRVVVLFATELEPHFQREETELLPTLATLGESVLVSRTLAEHEVLRALAQRIEAGDRTALAPFAEALADHVRFEERELFECAQKYPVYGAE
jgi:hemerythrin-like domain-containing protein